MYVSQTYTLAPYLSTAFLQFLAQKEVSAWDKLYDLYAPSLYGIIIKKVPAGQAEDVLAVIFLYLYDNFDLYIGEKERLFTWMYKITLTICDEAASAIPDERSTPVLPPTERSYFSLA